MSMIWNLFIFILAAAEKTHALRDMLLEMVQGFVASQLPTTQRSVLTQQENLVCMLGEMWKALRNEEVKCGTFAADLSQ